MFDFLWIVGKEILKNKMIYFILRNLLILMYGLLIIGYRNNSDEVNLL